MKRALGFCLAPLGGLIIMTHFSHFAGLLANALTYTYAGEPAPLFILTPGFYLVLGITLFWLGIRLLKGEIGIVFICLGGAALMAGAFGIIQELFGFSTNNTFQRPFAIGEFAANCLLILSAVVLIVRGIASFSKMTDERVIDNEAKGER